MDDLWINLILRLQALTWIDWLDLALVTVVFFVLVTWLQRAQATFILRGLALIGLLLLLVAFLLPLPTFGLLVRGILLFLVIAIPVVFQRELRHLLENVGRRIGFAPSIRHDTEEVIQPLVRAVSSMASRQTGALIVLQGEMALDQIAETGVAIGGQVSSELLAAIFYDKNPLHDGAALIAGSKVVAAGCVLPVSRRPIDDRRRVGTRHRAAVGLSERTDALVVVLSEETGDISVARHGALERVADKAALRECILDFGRRAPAKAAPAFSLRALFNPETRRLRSSTTRRLRAGAGRLGMALLFAAGLWWFVLSTGQELPEVSVNGVPLQVEESAPGLALANELPETVDLVVRTTSAASAAVNEEAFVARVSAAGLEEGVHQLPVQVTTRLDAPVEIVAMDPETVEVDLARVAERSLPVTVTLEEGSLPAVYEVGEDLQVAPDTVAVSGPQSLVEQVTEVRATLALSNTLGPVETVQALAAVDEEGNEVDGVALRPAEVEVSLEVARRSNVREVGVAIITSGEPAPGYWVSGLSAQPSTVVLTGPQQALATVGGAAPTVALDISGAAGEIVADVPLDLAPEITGQTPQGEPLRSVRVTIRVTAHRGNLTVERPVELSAADSSNSYVVTPQRVQVLLSGPIATLREIQADPELVQVVVEVGEVSGGESVTLMPQVVAPEGVGVQVAPSSVTVSGR